MNMTPWEIYGSSNGEATKQLYDQLAQHGPAGVIALNLFRAAKCSERAKEYRKRSHRDEAYGRKQWSMDNLCAELLRHGQVLNIVWGWNEDPKQEYHKFVLYVDTPHGQASFHTALRGTGPDYPGVWDGIPNATPQRVINWVARILETTPSAATNSCAKAPADPSQAGQPD